MIVSEILQKVSMSVFFLGKETFSKNNVFRPFLLLLMTKKGKMLVMKVLPGTTAACIPLAATKVNIGLKLGKPCATEKVKVTKA